MSCVNNVSKMDIMLRTEQKICMQKMLTIMMKSKIMTAALNTFFIRLDAVNCKKITIIEGGVGCCSSWWCK